MQKNVILQGNSLDVLKTFEENSIDAVVTDLALGTAAEHLVCADLILAGFRSFLCNQDCPYDVAFELNSKLIRVQVKATRGPRNIPQRVNQYPAYMWHVKRAGKKGKRNYNDDDFDLLALVAVDTKKIAYLPYKSLKQTIHIRTHENKTGLNHGNRIGKVFSDFSLSKAVNGITK